MSLNVVVCVHTTNICIGNDPIQMNTNPLWIINPSDRSALEAAMNLQANYNANITAISIGGKDAVVSLNYCLGRGVNNAMHLEYDDEVSLDAYRIANILANAINDLLPDLVLCGDHGNDWNSSSVGPFLAEFLDLPQISHVTGFEIENHGRFLQTERRLERGGRQKVACNLPAVICMTEVSYQNTYVSVYRLREGSQRPREIKLISKQDEEEKSGVRLVEVSPIRTRPRRLSHPSTGLSAAQRMQFLMTGGFEKKQNVFEGPLEEGANKVISLLRESGFF